MSRELVEQNTENEKFVQERWNCCLIIKFSQPGFIHVRIKLTVNQKIVGELWEK